MLRMNGKACIFIRVKTMAGILRFLGGGAPPPPPQTPMQAFAEEYTRMQATVNALVECNLKL